MADPARGALGKNTRFASTVRRYARLAVSRDMTPWRRVSICHKWSLSRPSLWRNPEIKRGFYKDLMVCGDVWLCPVCSAKVSQRRADEISGATTTWGGSVFMATFTLQHTSGDSLTQLHNDLRSVYRKLKSGRWWQEFESRYGLVGSIASLEITVSQKAGWHPHLHTLFYSIQAASDINRGALEEELSGRFVALMRKSGRYVSATYGVNVGEPVSGAASAGAVGRYTAKWGLADELVKSASKSAGGAAGGDHYAPFELLDLIGNGAPGAWAGRMWLEYAEAVRGNKQLVWSRGLRQLLGLGKAETTDIELASQETTQGAYQVAGLPNYLRILRARREGHLKALADDFSVSDQMICTFIDSLCRDPGALDPLPNTS